MANPYELFPTLTNLKFRVLFAPNKNNPADKIKMMNVAMYKEIIAANLLNDFEAALLAVNNNQIAKTATDFMVNNTLTPLKNFNQDRFDVHEQIIIHPMILIIILE